MSRGFGEGVNKARYGSWKVGRFGWITILIFCAALVADQYWNYGRYTDAALSMLRQIRASFGW